MRKTRDVTNSIMLALVALMLAPIALLVMGPIVPACAASVESQLLFSDNISKIGFAQDAASPPSPDSTVAQQLKEQQQKLEHTQQKLDRQRSQIQAQEKLLIKQQREIDSLRTIVLQTRHQVTHVQTNNSGTKIAAHKPKITTQNLNITGKQPSGTSQASVNQSSPSLSGAPQAPVGQPPPEERPQLASPSMASQGGVLTPKGVFSFEPTFEYQYASSNQFLVEGLTVIPGVTIGSESVRSVVDRLSTFTLGGRLGITNRFEVEAEFPFVYNTNSTDLSGYCAGSPAVCYSGSQTNADGSGLGDIQFGAHYQINSGTNGWPYFIANLLVKSNTGRGPFDVPIDINTGLPLVQPTGTGFWAIQPSITMIYPSDPVVFFVNLRDIYQIPADVTLQPSNPAFITTPTRVHLAPGNGIGGQIGMGLAINDKASFSLAYENTYFASSTKDGATIAGSSYDIGYFDLGFGYTLNSRTTINLGIQIGATKAAPDTSVTLRIPVKFQVY